MHPTAILPNCSYYHNPLHMHPTCTLSLSLSFSLPTPPLKVKTHSSHSPSSYSRLFLLFLMSYTQNMYPYTNLSQPSRFDQQWKPTVAETTPNCPRCNSPNTKFCYYNNYSLTQPRYFCKACRRYWTKGGSLRNIPVGGGGCRKSRKRHAKPSRYIPIYSDKPNSWQSLRPDLALDGMLGGSSMNGISSSGSDCIDLEVLYAKYLNPGVQATTVVGEVSDHGDQGLGSCLDRVGLGESEEEDPFASTAFGLVNDCANFSDVDANLAWQQEEMDIVVDHMMSDMQHDQHLMGVDWMSTFGAF